MPFKMIIAIISTLISSIALLGVALSLLLQARQLRTNQIQVARAAHLELIKMALDNPSMAAEALGIDDSEKFVKEVFINWHFQYLLMSYEINQISKPDLGHVIRTLFKAERVRTWWSWSREDWKLAATRREKEFFAIVDGEFQHAKQIAETTEASAAPPGEPVNPSPPASR
jgi:Family of unknown function (DUF6082)